MRLRDVKAIITRQIWTDWIRQNEYTSIFLLKYVTVYKIIQNAIITATSDFWSVQSSSLTHFIYTDPGIYRVCTF
jgi:hypothetical protein